MNNDVIMIDFPQDAHSKVMERIGEAITGTGTAISVSSGIVGHLSIYHEAVWMIGVFGGFFVGIAGICITAYYKHLDNKRAMEVHRMREQEHKATMMSIKHGR